MTKKGIGQLHGGPPGGGWDKNGEHLSNPIAGPPNLLENGGFHGLAGRTDGDGLRSLVGHKGVVKSRFVGNPLAGRSSGGGLTDDSK